MNITALKELAGKLEAAPNSYANPALNSDIANALGAEAGNIGRIGYKMRNAWWTGYCAGQRWYSLPEWVSSFDKASKLCELVLPRRTINLLFLPASGHFKPEVRLLMHGAPWDASVVSQDIKAEAATPALALCLAIVRALIAQAETEDA